MTSRPTRGHRRFKAGADRIARLRRALRRIEPGYDLIEVGFSRWQIKHHDTDKAASGELAGLAAVETWACEAARRRLVDERGGEAG
jgi:hypothetical protein